MSDELDWILNCLGQPIFCSLCGTPTPAEDLVECYVPGTVIAEWSMVVFRLAWTCLECPDLGK